ncbi:MAG TPA: UDP-3-O-(3-hydroxymyristoyl)glucosamine N-acyltransferase [Burkholderiales bacterium]
MPVTLAELARRFGAQVRGAGETPISGVADFDLAGPGQITYVSEPSRRRRLDSCRAAAVVVSAADAAAYSGNALIVDRPQLCFARIAAFLHAPPRAAAGVHARAQVDPNARVAATAAIGANTVVEAGAVVGENAELGPGCYVGRGAEIGAGSRLLGHAWIGAACVLGRNCQLQPGVIVGSDGFGYAQDGGRWVKVPQLGRVVIGDDVEIGANSTIDRGALNDTIIGDGVKIDNLVQIAHNVRIGENTAIAACVGIAGSTTIGRRCEIGGQVGVTGHLTIADDVRVLAKSLVGASITEAGTYGSGIHVEPAAQWRRLVVRLRRLEETERRLRELEKKS